MSKRIIWLLVLAMALAGMAGCGNKVDTSSPVAVAIAAIEAINTGDPEEVCQYFTGVPAQQMRIQLDRLYSRSGEVKVENTTASLEYKKGIAARVWVSYDLIVEAYGETNVENVVVKLKMVDIEGVWLINEAL